MQSFTRSCTAVVYHANLFEVLDAVLLYAVSQKRH